MKNTRGSGGFRRLELAADRFFDVERVLAEASTLTPAAVLAMVAERDDSGTGQTIQEPAGR